jgi:RsiW-degrading membrane proteinase PrsW (M82 family)
MDNKRPGGTMKQPLGDIPTRSQLLPFQANWRTAMAKAYFLPGLITVVAVVLLFSLLDSSSAYTVQCFCKVPVGVNPDGSIVVEYQTVPVGVPMYLVVLALFITSGLAYAAYRIIGRATALWIIPAVAAVTWVITDSPLLNIAHQLDFGVHGLASSFSLMAIVQGFFSAGLPEEALKAVPVAVGVWIARRFQDRNALLWGLRVLEPLDGILIGVASGLGFTLNETLTQYVPQQIVYAHFHLVGDAMAGELLIPRILQNIAGHAAWAGIFGYYIGLAALRGKDAKRLVLVGLGLAALLHGAWDGSGKSVLVELIVAVVSFVMFATVIMKARELSPHRSQLLPSQILEPAVAGARPAPAAPRPTSNITPTPGGNTIRSETWGLRSETWDEAPRVEHLEVAGTSLPLTVGTRLTESQIPGLQASAGDGVVAIVAANPEDPRILGLKNLSTQTWHVETVGRGSRDLSTGRAIRIERGVRIQLGTAAAMIK